MMHLAFLGTRLSIVIIDACTCHWEHILQYLSNVLNCFIKSAEGMNRLALLAGINVPNSCY